MSVRKLPEFFFFKSGEALQSQSSMQLKSIQTPRAMMSDFLRRRLWRKTASVEYVHLVTLIVALPLMTWVPHLHLHSHCRVPPLTFGPLCCPPTPPHLHHQPTTHWPSQATHQQKLVGWENANKMTHTLSHRAVNQSSVQEQSKQTWCWTISNKTAQAFGFKKHVSRLCLLHSTYVG